MKTYVVQVITVPQEFTVAANSEAEAKWEAGDRFRKGISGLPIQEVKILEVSPI